MKWLYNLFFPNIYEVRTVDVEWEQSIAERLNNPQNAWIFNVNETTRSDYKTIPLWKPRDPARKYNHR